MIESGFSNVYYRIGQIFCESDRNNIEGTSKNNWANYGFSRDLTRIIFSNSYKRLAGKTQIFPTYYNEHLMTRLTHTLVVNNIAMDISQRINKIRPEYCINLDLVQAIANGHDIGHTPFGHAGERELNYLVKKYINIDYFFKHNYFSVEILQNLDKIKSFDYGYDLSWQVIDGILKHTDLPKLKYQDAMWPQFKNKFLVSNSLKKALNELGYDNYLEYPYPLTIEGQIVKISDEIAQYYHDVLDLSRYFKNDIIFLELIKTIFNETNFELDIIKDYEKKFYSTFMKRQALKKQKILDKDNREFFANEIKEVFINDIVYSILNKNKIKCVKINNNKERFIVENIIFQLDDNGKVLPMFSSSNISNISKVLSKYRDDYLKDDMKILFYDKSGRISIKNTFELIADDKILFNKYCSKEIVYYVNDLITKRQLNFKINNILITKKNIAKYKTLIVETIFNLTHDKNENFNIYSKNEIKFLKTVFYGTIIEAVARMTDHYILDKKFIE